MRLIKKILGMTEKRTENVTYLLSYPRSGNSWVRYIAEYISARPTIGCMRNPEDVPLCKNTLADNPLQHVDAALKPILYKSHGRHIEPNPDNKLILLTRCPSVVIRRHCGGKFPIKELFRYINLLKIYDNWQGDKILLRYEDLLKDPKKAIADLVTFLDLEMSKVSLFIDSYDFHKEKSIRLYSDESTGLASKGVSKTRGELNILQPNESDIRFINKLLFLMGKSRMKKYFCEY